MNEKRDVGQPAPAEPVAFRRDVPTSADEGQQRDMARADQGLYGFGVTVNGWHVPATLVRLFPNAAAQQARAMLEHVLADAPTAPPARAEPVTHREAACAVAMSAALWRIENGRDNAAEPLREALRLFDEQPAQAEPVAPGTPSSRWRAAGEPDPHGSRYDVERAALVMGDLTDDELANGAFMNYDVRPSPQQILAGAARSPIMWMTAVKDRIRWLSRKLDEARAAAGQAAPAGGA